MPMRLLTNLTRLLVVIAAILGLWLIWRGGWLLGVERLIARPAGVGIIAIGQPTATPTATPTPAPGELAARTWPDTSDRIALYADQLNVYTMSEAQFQFAATHYVGAQKLPLSVTRYLRDPEKGNPDFLVLHTRSLLLEGYMIPGTDEPIHVIEGDKWITDWDAVDPHDDWFLKGAGGQRVERNGWYLMRPDSGWLNYWLAEVQRQLAINENDGVFANLHINPFHLGVNTFAPPLDTVSGRWGSLEAWNEVLDLLSLNAQLAFGDAYVFIADVGTWEVPEPSPTYRNVAGVWVSNFLLEWQPASVRWQPSTLSWQLGGPYDVDAWRLQMDRILDLTRLRKIVILQTDIEPADVAGRLFVLSNYLLVKGERSYLASTSGMPEFYPETTVPLGRYIGQVPAAIQDLWRPEWGVYARDYEAGLVLVNPGPDAVTITLDTSLYQVTPVGGGPVPPDGVPAGTLTTKVIDTVPLAPVSGAILLSQAVVSDQ